MKTLYLLFVLCFNITINTSYPQYNTWTYKADMSLGRTVPGAAVFNNLLYVIGGSPGESATGLVEAYDPVADAWSEIGYMPSARCYIMCCTYKDKIYIFGGSWGLYNDALPSVYVFDPQTANWTQKDDMPYAVSAAGIAVVADTIYIIGGVLNYTSPPIATVLGYEPETDTWTQKKDLPTARALLSASALNGKIYAVGGTTEDYNNVYYDILEVYDPSTDSWVQKSGMPTSRYGLITLVSDGLIYAIGGRAGSSCANNEAYDPVTDIWYTKEPMQQSRIGLAGGVINNKIIVAGGHQGPPVSVLSSCEEYTPDLTDVKTLSNLIPSELVLLQNYPNPFNPATKIEFSIPELTRVQVNIYDVLGNEIETLINEEKSAGTYELTWNAANLPSGVYFYQLRVTPNGGQAGDFVKIKKMLLIK